jgi:hypothetical protein
MEYTKKYLGLPPAANGVDDGKWWPWAVIMRYSDGRVQQTVFHAEAEADDFLRRCPEGSVVPLGSASWAV